MCLLCSRVKHFVQRLGAAVVVVLVLHQLCNGFDLPPSMRDDSGDVPQVAIARNGRGVGERDELIGENLVARLAHEQHAAK